MRTLRVLGLVALGLSLILVMYENPKPQLASGKTGSGKRIADFRY